MVRVFINPVVFENVTFNEPLVLKTDKHTVFAHCVFKGTVEISADDKLSDYKMVDLTGKLKRKKDGVELDGR